MEPVPESARLFELLGRTGEGLGSLSEFGEQVQQLVPSCVGLSLTLLTEKLTVTLVSSDGAIAGLDALQFLQDGPCEQAIRVGEVKHRTPADPLDEENWRLFAQAESMFGITSTLSIPIRDDAGAVTACLNLYARDSNAFDGHIEQLADLSGGDPASTVRNADLSFNTRLLAAVAPVRLAERDEVDLAVGWLSGRLECDVETAERRLREAAVRANISVPHLAQIVNESSMR
jgi:hypothetical protein